MYCNNRIFSAQVYTIFRIDTERRAEVRRTRSHISAGSRPGLRALHTLVTSRMEIGLWLSQLLNLTHGYVHLFNRLLFYWQ